MFSLEPTRYANTLGKVDLTKWTWNKLAVFLLVLTHLSPYYPNSDAGHSIECKLTPATRSPSSLKCFCTLWPMTLTFDFWPNIKWVDRTDDVASLVVVASAVFVLSCGQTNSYTNRRGRGLSLAWVTNLSLIHIWVLIGRKMSKNVISHNFEKKTEKIILD